MRRRFLIEEYGPELHYLTGKSNIVADYLSRLPYNKIDGSHKSCTIDKSDITEYPLSYKLLMKYQQKDENLLNKLKTENVYVTKEYITADKVCTLITKDNKVSVPGPLKKPTVKWYHKQLYHPGVTCTDQSICQYFIWNRLTTTYGKKYAQIVTCVR